MLPVKHQLRLVWGDATPSVSRLRLRDLIESEGFSPETKPATRAKYRQLASHWSALTRDPYLDDLSERDLQDFCGALGDQWFRRGPAGSRRRLSVETQRSILRCLRTTLHRAGAQGYVIPELPRIGSCESFPKNCLTFEQLVSVVSAASSSSTSSEICGIPSPTWWRAAYSVAFYCGCRRAEMLRLTWDCVVRYRRALWLSIPPGITKTKRARRVILHPLLASLFDSWPAKKDGAILPIPCIDHTFVTRAHYRWQSLAGIAADDQCCWHSLRNSLAEELTLLGAAQSLTAASKALGHTTTKTTKGHYLSVENVLIPSLPPLWVP